MAGDFVVDFDNRRVWVPWLEVLFTPQGFMCVDSKEDSPFLHSHTRARTLR